MPPFAPLSSPAGSCLPPQGTAGCGAPPEHPRTRPAVACRIEEAKQPPQQTDPETLERRRHRHSAASRTRRPQAPGSTSTVDRGPGPGVPARRTTEGRVREPHLDGQPRAGSGGAQLCGQPRAGAGGANGGASGGAGHLAGEIMNGPRRVGSCRPGAEPPAGQRSPVAPPGPGPPGSHVLSRHPRTRPSTKSRPPPSHPARPKTPFQSRTRRRSRLRSSGRWPTIPS